MKLDDLRKLVKEELQSALVEKQKITETMKFKSALKKIIAEVLEDRRKEFEKTCVEIAEELDKEAKKINKSYSVTKNDAGNFELCGCEPHHIFVRPRWNNNFEVLAYKDKSDRTKKIGLSYEDVVKFIKETLTSEQDNYVDAAYNKSAEIVLIRKRKRIKAISHKKPMKR